jgi:flagella basal body P-ring formation protein FlgA
MTFFRAICCWLFFLALQAQGAEWQSLPAIQSAVESFVQDKLANQPGEHSVNISRIDPRLKLATCDNIEPYLPPGNRLWGHSSIGVRCTSPATWSIYVPVYIKVSNNVLVAARPIASGQTIQSDDVQLQMRDITQFAGSALTAPEQAIDKQANGPIGNGTILRSEMLRAADIILQGQSVKLIAQGAGFRVSSDGLAMNNAKLGQVVAVKTRSGQVIKGIAKSEGVVEVYF